MAYREQDGRPGKTATEPRSTKPTTNRTSVPSLSQPAQTFNDRLTLLRTNIPAELQASPQWVVWKLIQKRDKDKPAKVPFSARTGRAEDYTDPRAWLTFEKALAASRRFDGIGYVFSADDPFCGVDIDGCVHDGCIDEGAQEIIGRLDSFTEFSLSGSGVHIYVRADKPSERCRRGSVEIYTARRFFVVTGLRVPGSPATIEERQSELTELHSGVFGDTAIQHPCLSHPVEPLNLSDSQILQRALRDDKFRALWHGDTGPYDGDESRADQALCNKLAFYTGRDAAAMDRLFRQSGLYREKWERQDYRSRTLQRAIDGTTRTYTGRTPTGRSI